LARRDGSSGPISSTDAARRVSGARGQASRGIKRYRASRSQNFPASMECACAHATARATRRSPGNDVVPRKRLRRVGGRLRMAPAVGLRPAPVLLPSMRLRRFVRGLRHASHGSSGRIRRSPSLYSQSIKPGFLLKLKHTLPLLLPRTLFVHFAGNSAGTPTARKTGFFPEYQEPRPPQENAIEGICGERF
jgi:hypothetical protein